MCFISSFTSERVDLPGDEREERVAMAEGYNYIKTLPSKQWVITLPRTLRGPAPAARHPAVFYRILPASQSRDCSFQTFSHQQDPSSCQQLHRLPLMCCQPSTLAPMVVEWHPIGDTGCKWECPVANSVSFLMVSLKDSTFPENSTRICTSSADSQRAEVDAKSRAEQELPGPWANKANTSL